MTNALRIKASKPRLSVLACCHGALVLELNNTPELLKERNGIDPGWRRLTRDLVETREVQMLLRSSQHPRERASRDATYEFRGSFHDQKNIPAANSSIVLLF